MRIWYTIITTIALLASCTVDMSGGISDHGNERVAGIITKDDGTPAAGVRVTLLPNEYNHITDSTKVDARVVVTDEEGRYTFDTLSAGEYTIRAENSQELTAAVLRGIKTVHKETVVPSLMLQRRGVIYFNLDSTGLTIGMMIFLPGMRYYRSIDALNKVVLSDVPAGLISLRAYDPVSKRVLDLGKNFLAVEVVGGTSLILPKRSQRPYCLTSDTVLSGEITAYAGEVLTFAPVAPSETIDARFAYRFSWGDGTISDWSSNVRWQKVWDIPGIYFVQVQVNFSMTYLAWSEMLTIEIVERQKAEAP